MTDWSLQLQNDRAVYWLICSASAYALAMREPTAVTEMRSHTLAAVSFELSHFSVLQERKRPLYRWSSHRNITPSWQCHFPWRQNEPEFLLIQLCLFSFSAVPREAIEYITTRGVMDHQRDVGHFWCTSPKLPVSTAASEIVLQ